MKKQTKATPKRKRADTKTTSMRLRDLATGKDVKAGRATARPDVKDSHDRYG